jgi:prepilin-type N-terminal cleavage/methylation domain-containing protein
LSRIAQNLRRRFPRNNQRGFTLIELLVVISILGILAAVVTLSMIGVTKLAQTRAGDTEKASIQAAIDTMANEQLVPAGAVCPGAAATSNMQAFPLPTQPSTIPSPPAGTAVPLYPRYVRQPNTHGTYTCDANGVVTQTSYNP